MFNFRELISKYSNENPYLKTTETEGYYDYENGGIWTEGEVVYEEFQGAVLPLGKETYYDNTGYTADDKKLYTYSMIENNQIVKHKGKTYTIMEIKDYSDFDIDLKIAILKAGGVHD